MLKALLLNITPSLGGASWLSKPRTIVVQGVPLPHDKVYNMTHKTTDISEPFTPYNGRNIKVIFTYKNKRGCPVLYSAELSPTVLSHTHTQQQQQFLDTTDYTSTLQITENAYKTNGRLTL